MMSKQRKREGGSRRQRQGHQYIFIQLITLADTSSSYMESIHLFHSRQDLDKTHRKWLHYFWAWPLNPDLSYSETRRHVCQGCKRQALLRTAVKANMRHIMSWTHTHTHTPAPAINTAGVRKVYVMEHFLHPGPVLNTRCGSDKCTLFVCVCVCLLPVDTATITTVLQHLSKKITYPLFQEVDIFQVHIRS